MNEKIAIIQARQEDAPHILELQKLAYQSEAELYHDPAIQPLTQTLPEVLQEFESNLILIAIHEGKLAGSVRGRLENGTCYIGKLMVHPQYQNQGLGSRLMQEIETLFPQASRFELFTGHLSQKNLYLYQKLGYQAFREQIINPQLRLIYLEKPNSPPTPK
jgi:ribosomal protein S18 acetylase RimI-like enzyme